MDWNNLHEVTAQNDKPAPGWLFKNICTDAQQNPQDIPDVAEFLMRGVASRSRTVTMKACLTIRHLADEVSEFRRYMQRCPEALQMLQELAAPPQLAQAKSIERPEVKVSREAAARALRSCLAAPSVEKEVGVQALRSRIQGFGNFAPPVEDQQQQGNGGLVNKVAGFVGDALADTVDDFREKGAVGAVRDGLADTADLLMDGVGVFWDFLGGRKNRKPEVEERICKPIDERGGLSLGFPAGGHLNPLIQPGVAQAGGTIPPSVPMPSAAGAHVAFSGAFGRGPVGAGHAFHPAFLEQVQAQPQQFDPVAAGRAGAQVPVEEPSRPSEPEDLLSFDDAPSPRGAAPPDLLSFGDGPDGLLGAVDNVGSSSSSVSANRATVALELKNRGNDLVRAKRVSEALKAYEAALEMLDKDPDKGSHEALRATLFANIASCYLQQQLYRRAADAATCSLEADGTNAKAYYRRCLAYRALKMFHEARRDLEALQFCRHEMSPGEMARLSESLETRPAPA